MPVLQPAELWRRTGRYEIDELFKLKDRKDAELVLAMTHEEVLTFHVAREVRSYRELPMILYHVQTKERDEPRPRAGVLRTREFTMKDSYSFDRDAEGLDRSYELHIEAYDRIFDRCGLRAYRVEADVGMMGGSGRPRVHGAVRGGRERGGARSRLRGQRRGRRRRSRSRSSCPRRSTSRARCRRPGLTTVEEVSGALGVPAGAADEGDARGRRGPRHGGGAGPRRPPPQRDQAPQRPRRRLPAGSRRGDRRGARAARVHRARWAPRLPVLKDAAIQGEGYVRRRQQAGHAPDRRRARSRLRVRGARHPLGRGRATWRPAGGRSRSSPRSRWASIFKLGTRYSEPLGATYLDEQGAERPIVMGSYGIGPARIVAAAIEQGADERGIVWPRSIAPWDVHLVGLGKGGDEVAEAAERLYEELREAGVEVVLRRPRRRAGREAHRRRAARLPAAAHGRPAGRSPREPSRRRRAAPAPRSVRRSPRRPSPRRSSCSMASSRTRRRLFGLDRSGPKPRQTRRGQPLRPAHDPEPGRLRAAGRDPRVPLPGAALRRRADGGRRRILFLAISAADYLDGFLARATGQYSRMGALLDPVIDRLTILAGVVVCWQFELLPRWALAVLAAREVVTLVLAQLALRRGVDLEINWVGRMVGLADHGRDLPGARGRLPGSAPRCSWSASSARCSPRRST